MVGPSFLPLGFKTLTRTSAAYQVGLSYLSTGMRRAVAACTSPEVFFGNAAALQPVANQTNTADALNLAMDTLYLNDPPPHEPISPSY